MVEQVQLGWKNSQNSSSVLLNLLKLKTGWRSEIFCDWSETEKNSKARTSDPNIKPDSSVGRGQNSVGGDLIRSKPESKTTQETVIKAEEPWKEGRDSNKKGGNTCGLRLTQSADHKAPESLTQPPHLAWLPLQPWLPLWGTTVWWSPNSGVLFATAVCFINL